jgi:hypothetical protein
MEAIMTSQTLGVDTLGRDGFGADTLVSMSEPPATEGRRSMRLPTVSPLSPAPTYVGIVLVLAGFVLLAITWGQVAGETTVPAQLPYFVSGGLVGLGLIMVGLTTLSIAAKRRDAQLRAQQIELLAAALDELRMSGQQGR